MTTQVRAGGEATAGDRWNPNWLSLPGAIMWVVSRDKRLTRWIDQRTNNNRGIQGLIQVALSAEQVFEGRRVEQIVQVADAWPALRGLIADEKIVVEGRSLERRGDIETRFESEPIPARDAGNLRLYDDVGGIGPKSALGADELYTLHSWQGRFWFDVRLRAADVFREFPPTEPIAVGPVVSTAAAITACRKWLREQMRDSPERRPKPKRQYYKEACSLFPAIGLPSNVKPSRGFETAWSGAMDDTGCKDVWGRAGAPQKSPR